MKTRKSGQFHVIFTERDRKTILTYFTNKLQGKKNLSFSLQGENDTPKNHSFPIGREFYQQNHSLPIGKENYSFPPQQGENDFVSKILSL